MTEHVAHTRCFYAKSVIDGLAVRNYETGRIGGKFFWINYDIIYRIS